MGTLLFRYQFRQNQAQNCAIIKNELTLLDVPSTTAIASEFENSNSGMNILNRWSRPIGRAQKKNRGGEMRIARRADRPNFIRPRIHQRIGAVEESQGCEGMDGCGFLFGFQVYSHQSRAAARLVEKSIENRLKELGGTPGARTW